MPDTTWKWEKTDPNRSGSSGDISKLFRHERIKNPGVLGLGAPPHSETLMAREVIQNSWDAATELQRRMENPPEFEIRFEFENLAGDRKRSFSDHLDLDGLAQRSEVVDRLDVGLTETDCLDGLHGDGELGVLVIEESGTTGMYGPWEGAKSKMYLALVSLGYTEKGEHAGGSYGYGKAGLIRGSAIRTVLAYSCFREQADEPGVTRRLLGMTYWGQHTIEETNYTGFARFGDQVDGHVKPFENEDADRVARALGLDLRDPANPYELGTTFVVVDPRVDPKALVTAIGRSWWPALEEGLFEVAVRNYDRNVLHPRPMQDEVLRSFMRAYRIASTPQDNAQALERQHSIMRSVDDEEYDLGRLGLVADTGTNGWSYADQLVSATDDEEIDHRSLVALTRSPRMIVEYWEAGRATPFVRGVFIASDEVDELLLMTEPKGHDSWQTYSQDGELDSHAAAVAETALKSIKYYVSKFRGQLKPAPRPREDVYLPVFDQFIRSVLSGSGRGWNPPVVDTRPVSIRLDYEPEAVDGDMVRVTGSAKYALSEHFQGEEADIEVSIRYRYIEDDRVGDHVPLDIREPDGFRALEGDEVKYLGSITRGEEVKFDFVSEPYVSSWSGRLYANAEVIPADEDVGE